MMLGCERSRYGKLRQLDGASQYERAFNINIPMSMLASEKPNSFVVMRSFIDSPP
jgi:hypothetical protein